MTSYYTKDWLGDDHTSGDPPGLAEIKDTLNQIFREENEGSTTFAFGSSLSKATNPGVFVHNHGMIGLPLTDHDAKAIIALAKESPFGHREHTLVDKSVRRSWELDPSQFQLRNPEWDRQVENIMDSVYVGLRLVCGRENVGVELYKLLLYEQGAFFKPHKDSEKAPGMFGTLVISLPSLHEGGKLQLKHDGNTLVYDFSDNSEFNTAFAAWYADITHEVLPVTSGRRVVLTYNLIRKTANASIILPQSGGDRQSRLRTTLDAYNSGLRKHYGLWPPFLVHELAHEYSEANLNFDSLKGEDHEMVQSLKAVCDGIGFELYLAILEKEVVMDDENDEFIEDSSYLKHIINVSGYEMIDYLELPQRSRLVKSDDSLSDADESEHEGWTGNEGAPAKYWYRNANLVIVPRLGKLEMMYKIEDKPTSLVKIQRLERKAMTDPDSLEQLLQMCRIVLSKSPYEDTLSGYQYSWFQIDNRNRGTQEPTGIFATALRISLDLDRLDIFDTGAFKSSFKVLTNYAQDLGRATARLGFDQTKSRLINILQAAPNSSEKSNFLDSVRAALEDASPDNKTLLDAFDTWRCTQLIQEFNKSVLRRADGIALANLCFDLDKTNIENGVWPIIMKSGIAARVAFLNAFLADQPQSLPSDERDFMRKLADGIWHDFKFPGYEVSSRSLTGSSNYVSIYYQPESPKSDTSDMLEPLDLVQLFATSIALVEEGEEEFDVDGSSRMIVSAIKSAPQEAFEITILPFIKQIVSNEVECLQGDENEVSENGKAIVSHALHQYVTKCVGKEPKAPTTWKMSPGSCDCKDCSVVNKFLADSKEKVLHFPCGKPRRSHLERTFSDRPGSLVVKTIYGSKPQVLQIRKTRTEHNKLHKAWKTRFEQAKKVIKDLGKPQMLKAYLGDAYDATMSLRVEALPQMKRPLAPTDGNKSTPARKPKTRSTTNSATKRNLDGIDTENITPKRLRSAGKDREQGSSDEEEQTGFSKSSATDEHGRKVEIIEID